MFTVDILAGLSLATAARDNDEVIIYYNFFGMLIPILMNPYYATSKFGSVCTATRCISNNSNVLKVFLHPNHRMILASKIIGF